MYKQKIKAILLYIILLSLVFPVQGQIFGFTEQEKASEFSYKITPYPLITRDSVRLEVRMKIPYASIQFIKNNDNHQAHFETSIYIFDSNDNQIASFIKDNKTLVKQFQKTTSSNIFENIVEDFVVAPGKYKVTMVLNDFETQNNIVEEKNVNVSDYYKSPITISSVNIIERSDDTLDNYNNMAISNTLLDTSNKFIIAFHILSDGGKGELQYEIRDNKNQLIKGKRFLDQFNNGITEVYIPVSKESLLYSRYKLIITVKLKGNSVKKETWFRLRWLGMSSYITDFNKAIEQLAYLATRREINRISKGDREERKSKFLKFWKTKDPTPGTEKNELMIEYYRRVFYANRNFSENMEGWRTDRGRIYIIYGPPDNVDRHPFEINTKPYIVWQYYNLNKTFYFVDETGFGDYRLINPHESYFY